MNRHVSATAKASLAFFAALCVMCASCDLFGRKPIYLYDQAINIANELIEQSFGILPHDAVLSDVTKTYAGELSENDCESGTARLYGGYGYSYNDIYIDSDSHKVVRSWDYDGLQLRYADYQRFTYHVTIVSGTLTADGTVGRETRYTSTGYSSYSTMTESGSIRVTGTVTIEGISEGEEVMDTVTIDLTKSLTGGSWFYNGTIENLNESWDIVME